MIIRLHPRIPKTPGHSHPSAQKEQRVKKAQINSILSLIASRALVLGPRPEEKKAGATPRRSLMLCGEGGHITVTHSCKSPFWFHKLAKM